MTASALALASSTDMAASQPATKQEDPKPWSRAEKLALLSPVAASVAIVISLFTYSSVSRVNSLQVEKTSETRLDERIDSRIDKNSAIQDIKGSLTRIEGRLAGIEGRISNLEGWREGIKARVDKISADQSQLKQHARGQQSIAALVNPSRILATIRAEIDLAHRSERPIAQDKVVEYNSAVRELPTSAHSYWETVSAIVNYQSLINQMSGSAPDPEKVSRVCGGLTDQPFLYRNRNTFAGGKIHNCIVDLDNNFYVGQTFVNCVVRYHNGAVSLRSVKFVNCRFLIDSPPENPTTQQTQFLEALLNSVNQGVVSVG